MSANWEVEFDQRDNFSPKLFSGSALDRASTVPRQPENKSFGPYDAEFGPASAPRTLADDLQSVSQVPHPSSKKMSLLELRAYQS
jgi:hypothetical protein